MVHKRTEMKPLVVLVTGGAGFIGSHTVVELLEAGHTAIVLDSCVNAAAGVGGALPPALACVEKITGKKVIFHQVSILDQLALAKIFKQYKIDLVIHFAALKAVGESVSYPLSYYQNNVSGTITLLQVMTDAGVKNIIFSSSATVYGAPQYSPIDEAHPTGPGITNPYGQTKDMCEQIMKDVAHSDKVWRVVLLRYFNPVGAHKSGSIGEDPKGIPNNLMPYISQVAVGKREKLSVFGGDYDTSDGTGVRDYIHVVDLAKGHVAAIKKLLSEGFSGSKAYNLGTGQGVSVLDMVRAFSKASGKEIPYEIVGRRAGDVATVVATCQLAKEELGWEAKMGLHEMCVDTWRWQSNNPQGFS